MWKVEKIVKKGEYEYAVVKGHPNATKYGYVLHHRIVMENLLGRLLSPSEVVHHKNGTKKDNRPENLEVLISTEHNRQHTSERGKKMVRLRCPSCKMEFVREKRGMHLQRPSKYEVTCCSRKCNGTFHRLIQLHGITHEVERAISENILSEFKAYLETPDNAEETETTGSVETIRTPPEMVKT